MAFSRAASSSNKHPPSPDGNGGVGPPPATRSAANPTYAAASPAPRPPRETRSANLSGKTHRPRSAQRAPHPARSAAFFHRLTRSIHSRIAKPPHIHLTRSAVLSAKNHHPPPAQRTRKTGDCTKRRLRKCFALFNCERRAVDCPHFFHRICSDTRGPSTTANTRSWRRLSTAHDSAFRLPCAATVSCQTIST